MYSFLSKGMQSLYEALAGEAPPDVEWQLQGHSFSTSKRPRFMSWRSACNAFWWGGQEEKEWVFGGRAGAPGWQTRCLALPQPTSPIRSRGWRSWRSELRHHFSMSPRLRSSRICRGTVSSRRARIRVPRDGSSKAVLQLRPHTLGSPGQW